MSKKQYRRFAGNAYNLIPFQFQFLSPEVHREISQKGGIASGRARLRKALMRDAVLDSIAERAAAMDAGEEFLKAVNTVMKQELRKRRRRKSRVDE